MIRLERPLIVGGRRFYPTEVRLPLWSTVSLGLSLSNFSLREVRVRLIDREPNFRGLARPKVAEWLAEAIDPRSVLRVVRDQAPVDGVEVVEWMHGCFVDNAIIDARCEEYNRLGSQLVGASGDPYIPGVVVEDCNFLSELGRNVSSRGYAVLRTPRGDARVNVGSKSTVVFPDLLSWGGVPWCGYTQWQATLLKWRSLASTPITSTIGFPTSINPTTGAFLSAPQFALMSPSRPALRVSVTEVFSSSEPQTMQIVYRSPNDFTRVLAVDWIDVPSGQVEISYTIVSFPYVPPTVHEMQPEDNRLTALNRFTTSP